MDQIAMRMLELKQRGYCCSQIPIALVLEAQGRTNADLVRSMAGLCYGAARIGEVCGALAGAACLISLYAAKGSEDEEADEGLPEMLSELTEWFREYVGTQYGGIRCDDIITCCPDKSACGPIVHATCVKVLDILGSKGFDLSKGKGGQS